MRQARRIRCSVCAHEHVKAVNHALLGGTRYRDLEDRFPPLSRAALWRHGKYCLKFDLGEAKAKGKIDHVVDVYNEMLEQFNFAKALRLAAEEYLADPENPEKVNLMTPRADEVQIIYYAIEVKEGDNVTKVKKTSTISELLGMAKAMNPDLTIEAFKQPKRIDIRRYALDVIQTVDGVLDKFARIEGLYTKERDNEHTVEKALEGLRLYMEKNPDATEEQLKDAISIFARGVSVSESVLMERAGIKFATETVQ